MSRNSRLYTALAGIDFSKTPRQELDLLFRNILNAGIHGISFSAYLDHQAPGSQISEDQIVPKLDIIRPYVQWVRSFSCTDGNEHIPRLAHEKGFKTLVGAWLGKDAEKNEIEIEGVIQVAKAGHADIVAVGNEVMLREDLSEDQIIEFILRVKQELPAIPVGYVDAYYEFELHPRIVDACDVILANCYPFWESCPLEHSFVYLKEMYHRAVRAAQGKQVIIAETGWPDRGTPENGAIPSYENALKYFINAFTWAAEENIEIFYFSSFDEIWKVAVEGDVGAYWGLWDKNGELKYG